MIKSIDNPRQVIFSLYIDIIENELDWQPPYADETESKTHKAKREFANNFDWIYNQQKKYADLISIDYKLYGSDNDWVEFKSEYNFKYPFLTTYDIINFYKIHLMYKLSSDYDEILYIDFDVVPVTNENFFKVWDLNKGIAILNNDSKLIPNPKTIPSSINIRTARSPIGKYWNSHAMLQQYGYTTPPNIYNTGIVGTTTQHLLQLDYFNNFDQILSFMTELKNDPVSLYPDWIHKLFGWDNETIWAFKMIVNNVPKQWLDNKWHYMFDNNSVMNVDNKFVHVINKNFTALKLWSSS